MSDQLKPIEDEIFTETLPPESLNISLEQAAQPVQPVSKEVNIDRFKSENTDSVSVDLFSEGKANDFIGQPTNPAGTSTNGQQANNTINQPVGGSVNVNGILQGRVLKPRESFRTAAKAVVWIIDLAMSSIATKVALDSNSDQYSMSAADKRLFEDLWTEYFYEKQKAMSPFWSIMFMYLAVYGMVMWGAIRHRKMIKAAQRRVIPMPETGKKEDKPVIKKPAQNIPSYEPSLNKPYTPSNNGVTEMVQSSSKGLDVLIPANNGGAYINGEQPIKGMSHLNPDDKIVANSIPELYEYVERGVYPMYIRNKSNPKVIKKVDYRKDGTPAVSGRRPKMR